MCRAKRRKVLESGPEAVVLAVELLNDAVAATPPSESSIIHPHIDELTRQLMRTRAKAISLPAKLFDLEVAHDKRPQNRENLLKKIRTKAGTSEGHIIAERELALFRYHGVLRSVSGNVKAVDVCNADHTDALKQLELLSQEGCKIIAVASSAAPLQEGVWIMELDRELKSKRL